jgi:voltage-gated potassium channel
MLLSDLAIGTAMIALSVVIHIVGLVILIAVLKVRVPVVMRRHFHIGLTRVLVFTVVGIFFLHTIEIWAWAALYLQIGEFETLSRALYFSTVTYTTLGFGDIVLRPEWQLTSSFEAANGIILFGVSTAFVFAVLRRLLFQSL